METSYYPLRDAVDMRLVGGKARMLGMLLRNGVKVPDGYVVSTALLRDFLSKGGLDSSELEAALNHDTYKLEKLRTIVRESVWPESILNTLKELYVKFDGKPLCARSSAVNEDGKNSSFAGIFNSSINIRSFGEFVHSVRDCWISAFDDAPVQYSIRAGVPLTLMAVVVQPLVDSVASGVAMMVNGSLHVSAAYGLCLGVVSGRVPCDTYKWEHEGAEAVIVQKTKDSCYIANTYGRPIWFTHIEQIWNGKMIKLYVFEADSENTVLHCKIIPYEHVNISMELVLDRNIQSLLSKKIYQVFKEVLKNGNWDFEWCISKDSEIHILQARPLVAEIEPISNVTSTADGNIVYTGRPISRGKGTGPACHIYSEDDISKVKDGDVLVLDWIPDAFIGILCKAKALIIGDGSTFSHCAIIAREWKIPCVGGVERGRICEGKTYTVDGSTGNISLEQDNESSTDLQEKEKIVSEDNYIPLSLWLNLFTNEIQCRPQTRIKYIKEIKKRILKVGVAEFSDALEELENCDAGMKEIYSELLNIAVKAAGWGSKL